MKTTLCLLILVSAGTAAADVDPERLSHCATLLLDRTLGCASTMAELPHDQCAARACAYVIPESPCRSAMVAFAEAREEHRRRFKHAQQACTQWLVALDPVVHSSLEEKYATAYLSQAGLSAYLGLEAPNLFELVLLDVQRDMVTEPIDRFVLGIARALAGAAVGDFGRSEIQTRRAVIGAMSIWLLPNRLYWQYEARRRPE